MPTDLTYLATDIDLHPLWQAIHDRLCAGTAPETLTTVRVTDMNHAGLAQLRTWLDTTTRRRRRTSAVTATGTTITVPVRDLLNVLNLTPGQLVTIVELAIDAPIVDRSATARTAAAHRDQLWQHAADQLPGLPQLVTRMRTAGLGEDDTDIRTTITALATVVKQLPLTPPKPLAKLAHDTVGNPHYFDLDRLAGRRLVAAIAEHTGQPTPTRPDLVRALLAESGIVADRLSATVLLFNVHTTGDGPIDRRLRDSHTPVALTLLDLLDQPPTLGAQTLTVVENPSVLEVAYLTGSTQPLACTSGQLRAVDHTLFRLAVHRGVHLRYAGDIDPAGQHIAAIVADTYGAELIAMDTATAQQAQQRPPAVKPATATQNGPPPIYQEHDVLLHRILQ
ncbi:TIGR02679 domain-containing protein [Actinoplanes sp. NPDC049316]|uniref:TIGR02679 domain-containing protein n=1 Tax=Actinoplanes sp. NPDC049316 TaxID=3154727 RepID=UPI00342CB2D9